MLLIYLKIALRFLLRNISFSIIKIVGLAIGMACFFIIYLWVIDELKYDKFQTNSSKLYRVVHDKQEKDGVKKLARTCANLGPTIKELYPEVKYSTRLALSDGAFGYNNQVFYGEGAYVDPDFFRMFSYPLLHGDKEHVLDEKLIVVISEDFAMKIFGKTDVVGSALIVGGTSVKVTGVMKNFPKNSHIRLDWVWNFNVFYDYGLPKDMWSNFNNPWYTYIFVENSKEAILLNNKMSNIITEHAPNIKTKVYLQPFNKIYLYSDFIGDYIKLGDIKNVYIFSILAILILIIACFNFMNLAIAQSTARAREVGMHKVSGASRLKIIWQFISESILIALFAQIVAILLVELVLPVFNHLFDKSLEVNYFSGQFVLIILFVVLITGIISGSYPAFYLSKLNPIKVLKESADSTKGSGLFRNILVVLQFTITITLIIVTGTMVSQLKYMKTKDVGFNKESVIYFSISDIENKHQQFKEQLIQSGKIDNITICSHVLDDVTHYINADWEGKDPDSDIAFNILMVDKDFISTMQMELVEGVDFSESSPNDTILSYIVNEEAVRQIGFKDPIGKKFEVVGHGGGKGFIAGVVKDFHFKPLRRKIEPMVFCTTPIERRFMYIRLKQANTIEDIKFIENKWNELASGSPFEYRFLDDTLNDLYKTDNKLSDLMGYSTILGIFISCLGLFGLASYLTERRTKEVGIRKAIGANNSSIVFLFTSQMIKWVLVSILISWPLSWYISNSWLQNFSYRIPVNYWLFFISALIAIVVAIISVVGKSYSKAILDPAKALRYE